MQHARYLSADPFALEALVTQDLEQALGRRGARVTRHGGAGKPDIVVELDDLCIVVEVAKRAGADAASEYLAILDHRAQVEAETGKPAHLLFSCIRTPQRIVAQVPEENVRLERRGSGGRVLFLDLAGLEHVLERLGDTPFDLYPNERWGEWFARWREVGSDEIALERLCSIVLAGDDDFRGRMTEAVGRRFAADELRLRKDVRRLEDTLRQSNVTGPEAMHSLVYIMFIKLYEELRELRGELNRFTARGFELYRASLPRSAAKTHAGRTLHHLLAHEIRAGPKIEEAGILSGVTLSGELTDALLRAHVFPLLDTHRFRGTRVDALGTVFEAIARRAEKDVRIGQFFTPEPIVRFAMDVVRPGPTEVVLDPAAGTGHFLTLSMDRMLERAGEVPGVHRRDVQRAIRDERVLGCDTAEWVATIARMNLYIHGGGEHNVRVANGLFLADVPVFGGRLEGAVDACVTNPPLGAMNYRNYAADLLRRHPGVFDGEDDWLRARLPILPGEWVEDRQIRGAEARIERYTGLARDAALRGDARAEARARAGLARAHETRIRARERLSAGQGTYRVRGDSAKGGALFLAAIRDYLKTERDPAAPEEWKGGRLGIVVDEAILNTAEYAETRRFIRRHYFVKAVFSFNRDAFWYQARTTAKTSLLYLVRKRDDSVRQREPVFFAHVERIGVTRLGKPGPSELPWLLEAYLEFEGAIRGAYRGGVLDAAAARGAVEAVDLHPEVYVQWPDDATLAPGARLDYAAESTRQLRARLPGHLPVLGDFVRAEVRPPDEDPSGFYNFATVDRTTGEVREAREAMTRYAAGHLRLVREGDLVVSGIDLVNGAVGYAYPEVDGLVLSKEFYTLSLRPECADRVDSRFLAILLQAPWARHMVAGRVTGTSNRTRIADVAALLAIPLPPLPPVETQRRIVAEVERGRAARRDARDSLDRALAAADELWKGVPRSSGEEASREGTDETEGKKKRPG